MALFTDGPVSSIEDLTAQDTQLESVASVEGIDVTRKLILAQEDLGLTIQGLLEGRRRAEPMPWLNSQATLRNVVATPALKLWHTYRTLELVYADAYSNQLNDRYAAKRDQFRAQANREYERLLMLGPGLVWTPMPRPAPPAVTVAAGSIANGTYYVRVSWSNSKGEEGAASDAAPVAIAGGTFAVQAPVPSPTGAAGWNIYAGADPDALWKQNASPLGVSQAWVQAEALTTAGSAPGGGQSPNCHIPIPRMILRG